MQTEQLKVSFFVQAKRADQHGNAPIFGRIAIGRSSADFSAKLKAPLTLWDSRKQRLLGKSHIAVSLNRKLNECIALIHTRYRELCERVEVVSACQLRDAYQGQMQEEGFLLKNFEAYLNQIQSRIGVDRALKTFKLRSYQLSVLREYVQKRYKLRDIALSQLDKFFIEGFEYYLCIDRGLKPSTIAGTLSTLQSIVLQAVRRGYLDLNPFMGYSYDRPKGEPRSITRAELQALIALEIAWENYRIVRDLFVFSCFTGLAISDVRNLREEQVVTEEGKLWIKSRRQKTKTHYRVQVLPPALAIMERYRGRRAGFVFDVPTTDVILNGMHYLRKQLQMDRPLTFHMARHTFASLITLSSGVPLETVSQMLGHSDLRTTQIYAQVSSERIRQDMQRVQARIQDTFTLKL
ncbi:site-specific integrase [Porphyromonas gulae]|uniref:site-specific integrase n=1 Tax=Porphyromonas gulae TaxID=111105 RepID=UPI00052BE1AB|nr:site-specific integrase [Porphyromonas gulae]KGN87833.1 transposase [Porphyromonas gulae]